MKKIFSKASEKESAAAAASGPPSLTLAFSIIPQPPLTSLAPAPAPGSGGPGLAPPAAIVKISSKYSVEESYTVNLSCTPLIVLFPVARFRGAAGEPSSMANLGRRWLPYLYEDDVRKITEGIDRYNRDGGKFLWLVDGHCAVNLDLVSAVKTAFFGRKIRIEFGDEKELWMPPERAGVRQAVERFARARANSRSRPRVSPAGPQKP